MVLENVEENEIKEKSTLEASFRISIEELKKFLYNPSFKNENQIYGLMIEFSKDKSVLNFSKIGAYDESRNGYPSLDGKNHTLNSFRLNSDFSRTIFTIQYPFPKK